MFYIRIFYYNFFSTKLKKKFGFSYKNRYQYKFNNSYKYLFLNLINQIQKNKKIFI